MKVKFSWLVFAACLIFLLPHTSVAYLRIVVEPNAGWGGARTVNIKALCENITLHFNEQLRDENQIDGKITIIYNHDSSKIYYRHTFGGDHDEYRIGLHVTDKYWDHFSYQFGHEFCHILHNFEDTSGYDPNHWFQEALCELANLWVIRRMSKTWAYRAPYDNWVDYRHNLAHYANNWMMSRPEVQYSKSGAAWLSENENRLRDNFTGHDYARVAQLSYKFLSIFDDNPEAWNAIRQLPTSHAKMSTFMRIWYNDVKTEDKKFVKDMAKIMGIHISDSILIAQTSDIDADINNDGYVDLSDVMIVRSAMQNSTSYDTDVNNDGITNEIDVLLVKAKAFEAIAAAAPSVVIRKKKLTTWGSMKRKQAR